MINTETLTHWYSVNKRDLPWRKTKNPYFIWLSEIILQQTQVKQGLPYYHQFIKTFPTVFDLAKAKEEKVLKLWQGLGYYSRARNLHAAANYVVNELNGTFPNSYKGLLKLKGVGDYTASAIASICYNEPAPVLDGNVYRFVSRYYGIKTPINTPKARKEFKSVLHHIIDKENPATFNQAIMEFGARQCKPQSPDCSQCPFTSGCYAYNQNEITLLPVKLKPNKVKKRHFNFLVFLSNNGETILEQRKGKGIWENLFQFPLLETEKELNHNQLKLNLKEYSGTTSIENIELFNEEALVHKLSHQHLYTKFWIIKVEDVKENAISLSEIKKYPVPILIANFIEAFNF